MPRLIHVTTTDVSLAWLLQPQLVAFAEAGFDVIGMSAPGPYVAELTRAGIRHEPIAHLTRRMAPAHDVRAVAELRRAFRRLAPDIVHTHNPKPGVFGRIAARAARVPVIVNTVHGLYALPEDRAAKRAVVYTLERIAARCSQAELVQNVEDIPVLERLGIKAPKVTALGNGIDLTRFDVARVPAARAEMRAELGLDDDAVVAGVVGRLVVEKGYREIFAAADDLAARAPNVVFVVIGPTDPEKADAITDDELRAATQRGNVRVLGERHDVESLYAAMDLVVIASWREGFSRTGMEAAAMGLPLVATDVRGCRQVVEHEETGLLVPIRRPDALAAAIARLAGDAETRSKMGAAGVEKARREFDQRRVIDLTLATYQRLLREQGRA